MYYTKLIAQNRSHKVLLPKGIVLHSTATPGATALNEQAYFSSGYRGASAHAFVDWEDVVQTIPYNEQAWHAGRTANGQFIGIEMCEPKNNDRAAFQKVFANTVNLLSDLFREQIKTTEVSKNTLLSHREVSAKWHETDHTDPEGYLKTYGMTMEDVREAVREKVLGIDTGEGAVSYLAQKGILNSPEIWKGAVEKDANIFWLIRKTAKYIAKNGGSVKTKITPEEGIGVLGRYGILTDEALWREKAADGNVAALLAKLGDYLN